MQRGQAGCLGREGTQVARAEWLGQGVEEVAGRDAVSAEGWWVLLGCWDRVLPAPCSWEVLAGGPRSTVSRCRWSWRL